MRILKGLLIIVLVLSASEVLASYDKLNKRNYEKSKIEKAVVIYGVNWGRQWGCAGFENAQLENLTFTRLNLSEKDDEGKIVLNTPSKLFVDNISKTYAIIVTPGEYALSGFDVKIAKSIEEIGHLKGDVTELFESGKPTGGTFKVSAGEIVYIGHFGLDCAYEPIPWRYYIQKEDFEGYAARFKKEHKFIADKQIIYRLFQTNKFGK